MTPLEFQSKVSSAKELDFGTVFSQSIELFKKSWLQGFLMQLFVFILTIPFLIIFYVPFVLMIVEQTESGQFNPDSVDGVFAGFSVFFMLLFIIGILVVATLQMALNAAFFRILKSLDEGLPVKTSDLFYFFKKQYLGKIAVLMIVMLLITIPAAIFFYLPFIYVMVPISFFSIVFSFHPEWSIGDIVSSSFRLGNKKWLLTFGLILISYAAIIILTFVTCGLGSLFLGPFMFHPIYLIYKGVIGFDDLSELNQIGEREVF